MTTCFNEIDSIREWTIGIQAQSRQPDQIIVVDSESDDGTNEYLCDLAKKDRRYRLITKKCNIAEGRNLAISEASYDVIVSTDLGCSYDIQWFSHLCKPFEDDEQVEIVAGNYQVKENDLSSVWAWADYFLAKGYRIKYDAEFLPSNRSLAFKKNIWEVLAGYPEDLKFAADDTVFSILIRSRPFNIVFAELSICYWKRPKELKKYVRQNYMYAFGNGEACILAPSRFKLHNTMNDYFQAFISSLRTPKRVCDAAIRRKWLTAIVLPYLSFVLVMGSYRGFRDGIISGQRSCAKTRSKLKDVNCKYLYHDA